MPLKNKNTITIGGNKFSSGPNGKIVIKGRSKRSVKKNNNAKYKITRKRTVINKYNKDGSITRITRYSKNIKKK